MSEPNDALAALIREADERSSCSWAGLARRVNNLGAAQGLALRYDYTAVNRWIKRGERPRPPVPTLIANALAEKLGRRIDPSEFGMLDEQSLTSRTLDYSSSAISTVETITELGRADVNRRNIIKAPFVLAAMAAPSRDWLIASLEATAARRSRRIGMDEVISISEMFGMFQEMDVMRGGGHARTALVEYMNSYVLPLVRCQHGTLVQQALYEAAAKQTYLIGWMAYDDGQHGLAQRYLIQALRLSEAGASPALGAHVLAGLSDQANLLGYHKEALALARAGRRGIAASASESVACLADLLILEARALAALGLAEEATRTVTRAEGVFDQIVQENEPEWARFIDRAYFFGEAAHCFRDLGQPTQIYRFAGESIDAARKQRRARRGALSEAALAVGDIARGEVEAAAQRGVKVIGLAVQVNSSRCLETVVDLKRRFRPFAQVPEVVVFNQRATELLGLPAY